MTEHETFEEVQPKREGGRVGTALTFLFIGLGLGALAALLAAPASGSKTRKMLRRRYQDAMEAIGEVGERAEDVMERGGKWARSANQKVAPITRRFRRG